MKKISFTSIVAVVGIVGIALVSLFSTQFVAKRFGGSYTIELAQGERLENITWKGDQLWILTKPDTTLPNTYTLQEDSTFNVLEGTITIKEK